MSFDRLAPCPFCGSREVHTTNDRTSLIVICGRCSARGPAHCSERQAVEAWNRRAPGEKRRAALLAAADLIERLDGRLTDLGQGANLSSIAPAQGYHFPGWLRALARETP